jgi:O-antigen/teichoic acid export membrane protein
MDHWKARNPTRSGAKQLRKRALLSSDLRTNSIMSTTKSKLLSGSIIRLASSVATALVTLLIMPFVVHSLGDRMYGIWTLVAAFIGYYGVLDLGLSQAISRYLARSLGAADSEECNRIFNTSLRIYLLIGGGVLLLTTVLAGLAPLFCRDAQDAALFWKVILILGISAGLQFPTRVFGGVLEAHLRFDLTAGLDLLTLGLRTVLVVSTLLLGYRVVGLACVTLLAGIPAMALSVYWTRRELPFLRFDSKYWKIETAKTLFSYSAFSFIAHLAYIIRFRVDSVVVAAFVGLAAVTHYSIAGRLTQYFIELVSALLGVLPSLFSRLEGAQDFEALKRTLFFGTKLAISITTFFAFGLLAWGKPFINRWMGPRYADAYPALAFLTLGLMFGAWQTPSISLLYGISRHRFLAMFNTVEALANLMLSLVLVRRYGMVGVAVGTTVPIAINMLVVIPIYVCRVSKIDYFEYVRNMARTLGVALPSLVLPALLSLRFAAPDYSTLLMVGISSAILYALPLWLFEFTPAETLVFRQAICSRLTIRRSVN